MWDLKETIFTVNYYYYFIFKMGQKGGVEFFSLLSKQNFHRGEKKKMNQDNIG